MNAQITLVFALLALLSLAQTAYVYGTTLAFFWRKFPVLQDEEGRRSYLYKLAAKSAAMAIIPGFGLFTAIAVAITLDFNKHGWMPRLP